MKRALSSYVIMGVKTTIPFHLRVMSNRRFIEGNFDTNFISREFSEEKEVREPANEEFALLAAAIHLFEEERKRAVNHVSGDAAEPVSMWKNSTRPGFPGNWRVRR